MEKLFAKLTYQKSLNTPKISKILNDRDDQDFFPVQTKCFWCSNNTQLTNNYNLFSQKSYENKRPLSLV